MSSVHSKDTNIEVILRKALWHKGSRYRKNLSNLPGKPDIAITKYHIAIFCDADFWHGKNWDKLKVKLGQGKNPHFWINKIENNRKRDIRVDKQLNGLGWIVLRFWGNDILKHTEECVKTVEEAIIDRETHDEKIIEDF